MLAGIMAGETSGNANGIARSLDRGWHYRPAWRNAIVEAYLVEKQLQEPPLEALKGEEDGFVRQFYLFRRCGRCLNGPTLASLTIRGREPLALSRRSRLPVCRSTK